MNRPSHSRLTPLFALSAFLFAGIGVAQTAPVLVVGNPANPFATYYTQILKTEGLNSSEYLNLASVTAASLTNRDVVILGETALTAAQVSMFTTWVNGGGNLIAMRPDKQLAGLLGLTDQGTTLSNAYIGVNTSQAPGFGIVGQTMQFHGASDRYTLNGATSVATLFTNATAATTSPAVTWRSVGASGGKAAAFTYDLAKSIVYTRQGNPAWAGTERDGLNPAITRSDDMFFGAAAGDIQPDWVDRTKIAIPQADEQQRLLANLIGFLNLSRKPLPRFWYFPFGKKAAVVMTGDDHAIGGTAGRFDAFNAASTPGCVVANWECIRGTSYIYPNTPITPAQAQGYDAQGHEIALHLNTNCANYTPASFPGFLTNQLQQFLATFSILPSPVTNRTHCIVFSDWATQPKVELANGIRLDTTYYYWPDTWVNNTPGFMTGSGMPQRFADLDGTVIDTYQAETQMTDESGQSYPLTSNTLLDRALGAEGYYGFFVANIHTDYTNTIVQTWAMNVVDSAKARGVPVITAKQALTWLDARNNSTFTNLVWSGNTLTFTLTPAANSTGLQTMLPTAASSGTVAFITRNGNNVPFTTQTIKGVVYAIFTATAGNYTVSYSGAQGTIIVSPTSATIGEGVSQNLTATVSGLANTAVTWSMNPSFGTLTPTGANTATYTAPASAPGNTVVQVIATATGAPSLTATSTITVSAPPCPCNIWNAATLPSNAAEPNDGGSIELGVKFRATEAGFIRGIRFYKGATNVGTHVGSLWSSTGTNLASATFINETATGWQQVLFDTPVAVAANTTYVASYYAPQGHYAFDSAFFNAAVVTPPLRALANGEDGPNGLYRYNAGSAFPNASFNATNYWVDVVFVTSIGNQTPIAVADSYNTIQNQPLTVAASGVLSNDTDADGNTLTAIKVTDPASGSVVLNSNGSFTFTPANGFTGAATFTYKANDGTIDSNTATVTINVAAIPVATNDTYSANAGQANTIAAPGVLSNDTGGTLTAVKVTDPANGTLVLNANGSFTFTPTAGFSGSTSFTYRANNGAADSNIATVTLNVTVLPVAANDSYTAARNTALTIAAPGLLVNDTGTNLSAIEVTDSANGSTTVNANGSFTFTPTTNYTGTTSFTYRVNNGTVNSNTATVTIAVQTGPVAVNDFYTTNAGTTLTVAAAGLLANDVGTTLTAVKLTNPASGTATVNSNGSFTYVPAVGFAGNVSFTYLARFTCSGLACLLTPSADSNTATVNITVVAAPVAPTAVADAYNATANTPLNVAAPGVLSNDTSPGGLPLTAAKLTDPANGTLVLNANGSFTFTPTTGFTGSTSFTYRANNGSTNSNTATVTITVSAAPVATNDAYNATSGVALTVVAPGLLSNDTGGTLTAIKVSDPANGTVTVNANGSFTYTSTAGFSGTNTFTYKANNGSADSNVATVTITVKAAPVAVADLFNGTSGLAITVAAPGLLSNDTSPGGLALTAIKVANPANGTVTVNPNGGFTYTPNSGFSGTDSFTYKANNGTLDSNTVTVTLCACTIWNSTVVPANTNEPTDTSAVELGVKFRATQNGFIRGIRFYKGTGNNGVHVGNLWNSAGTNLATANFANETATGWQQVLFSAPVAVTANTTYVASYYAPVGSYAYNSNYFASAVVNGPLRGLATGEDGSNGLYRYGAGGGFPNATWNSTNYWVDVVFVTSIGNQAPVAVGDSYAAIQNQPLTIAAAGVLSNDSDADGGSLTAIKVTDPTSGTVSLNSNGGFTYTPVGGFTGSASFTYKANDGAADSNTATVTITVNALPIATNDAYSVNQNQTLTVSAPGVLSNDTSPGGFAMTMIRLTDPANGSVTSNANGSFTFTPTVGFSGTTSFTYKANSTTGDSNTATVTITVIAIPVANNDSYSGSLNTPLTVAAPGLLSNDTGTNLSAIEVADSANGTTTVSPNGGFTFTPTTGYTGTTSFTYKVNNGLMDSNVATVTITVTAAPVATNDAYVATSGVALNVVAPGLLSNDTGGTLTAIKLTNPANGTATVNANGSFTYTSTAGFTGTNTFTYKANNGTTDSNTATVTITVNAAPTAVADLYNGTSGQAITIAAPGLLSNDTSPGGFALTAIKVANPANGTVTVNPNGGFTYTPTAGFVGTDSFTYKANNGTVDSNTVTVTLCACTMWASTTLPTNLNEPSDTAPVELGVKFRATQAGYIKGIRFYKGTGNTGTHIANLWSSTGTKLATANFVSETATGWQQVLFTTPVAVTANTTYVASYYAPVGNYAWSGSYFASTATVSGPLRGLATGEDGSNGVYRYGTGGGFPDASWLSTNYWVDVVFTTVP
ncbi:MAG: Ig-like domain-containing protein [Bryobacteraceae bacterium]